jgi:hypothetical protein
MPTTDWKLMVELDESRQVKTGSHEALVAAVNRGADVRVCTKFRHNEHVDPSSSDGDMIQETMDFRLTYLMDKRWVSMVQTLRQPIGLPDGFGPRASMSFFLYNMNGQQAIARPHLDGPPVTGPRGASPPNDHSAMPRYHEQDHFDAQSNAPSSNFIYDFYTYRFMASDTWHEVLHHDADGKVISGSAEALAEASWSGCELKVGIQGLASDLAAQGAEPVRHEAFIHVGSTYFYTDRKRMCAGTNPLVRIRPAIPMRYVSGGWDFGWLMVRSDGHCAQLLFDPYTLISSRKAGRHEMRWFYR